MGPEQFGEKLRVERSPSELRLLIQARKIRFKRGVWPALIGLIALMIGIGIVLWFWMGPPFSFGSGTGRGSTAWQDAVWLFWLLALVFLLLPPAAVITMSRRRKVTVRTAPDASIQLRTKQPYDRKSVRLERSEIKNLRLQHKGEGSLLRGDGDTVMFGLADWWLRFETPNAGAYAINIPIDDEHTDRFAGMIGDAFGQRCEVICVEPDGEDRTVNALPMDR